MRIGQWLAGLCRNIRKRPEEKELADPAPEQGNPWLPRLRVILEQVLEQYHMTYREFAPLLIDTDTPPESLLDEDDVEIVLEQISGDLNFLKIMTDRPAYFETYIERMYEDTGLAVQVAEKGLALPDSANVVLDMERKGNYRKEYMREGVLYIPLYKKPWNGFEPGICTGGEVRKGRAEMLQNLDISVPIGYNTVIVKGR